MKNFMKAIAAIMLTVAVVITAGCNKKPENPEQTVTLTGMWYANDQWFENEHDRVAIDFVNSNTLIWYGTVSTNKNAFQNMEGVSLQGCTGWYYFSKTYYTYVLTDNKIFFNDRIFTIFEDYLVEDGSSSQWKPWNNGNDVPPTITVTTYNPTDITSTEATCGAEVTAENGSNIRELGICWGTSAYPTIENDHLSTTTWNTPFVSTISDLTPNTRYHVRAYALNGTTFVYGDDKSFTTLPEGGGGGQTYTITATANPSNGGMLIGSGTYQEGQQCTLIATANSGYDFVNWTEEGTEVSSDLNYTFSVNANRNLVANFIQQASQNYTITVSANPSVGGMVSGGGTYQQGQTCIVNAVANMGYSFENWTENGTFCSMDENYSFVVNSNRSLVANFTYNGGGGSTPTGAINGKFTISDNDDQVYFSQGNLQYKASTNTWQFAANQYEFIGYTNSNISSTYSDWIDLFGWGTSGWNNGNTYYCPWDSDSGGDLYGPPGNNNLIGSYINSDWGYYNKISNGGNTTHQWRTLMQNEWDYVFNRRRTTSGIRYAKANVNWVNGVILLPDNWSSSYYALSNPNSSEASFSSNNISSSTWTNSLQSHGAVFLPEAGYRIGTSYNYGGCYWSATFNSYDGACAVSFHQDIHIGHWVSRHTGSSVRLVCPAE